MPVLPQLVRVRVRTCPDLRRERWAWAPGLALTLLRLPLTQCAPRSRLGRFVLSWVSKHFAGVTGRLGTSLLVGHRLSFGVLGLPVTYQLQPLVEPQLRHL